AAEQPMHDLECFLHAGDARGGTWEGKTERALVEVLTRPDAEDESGTRQTVGGGRRPGDRTRVVVDQAAGDTSGHLDPCRPRRHRTEPRPDAARRRLVVHPGVEVIGPQDRVEAGSFRRNGLVDEDLGLIGLMAAQPGELLWHRPENIAGGGGPRLG